MASLVILIHILVFMPDITKCINLCGDWTQYKDIKCIKVIKDKTTANEALLKCRQLDGSSSLITINDQDEQDFFSQLLIEYIGISTNAWIGMKYNENDHNLVGRLESNFSSLAGSDGDDQCLQISLASETYGKWLGESCKNNALVVCQRRPDISVKSVLDLIKNFTQALETKNFEIKQLKFDLNLLKTKFIPMSRMLEKRNKELLIEPKDQKSMNDSYIPIGFVYTQFPDQLPPQQLWSNMKWAEVTQQYSGLFFRAEGSESEAFGQIQAAGQNKISSIRTISAKFESWQGNNINRTDKEYIINEKGWSEEMVPGEGNSMFSMRVLSTQNETRPRNTAIRIWKRLQ